MIGEHIFHLLSLIQDIHLDHMQPGHSQQLFLIHFLRLISKGKRILIFPVFVIPVFLIPLFVLPVRVLHQLTLSFQNLRLSVAPALFDILHRHIKLPFIPEVEQIQPPVSLLQVKLLQHGLIRAVHPIIVRRIITVSVIGLSVRAEHIQMIRVKIIGIQNRQMKIMQRPPSSNPYHPVVVPVILGLYSEYIFLRHFSPVPSLFLLFQKPVFIIP